MKDEKNGIASRIATTRDVTVFKSINRRCGNNVGVDQDVTEAAIHKWAEGTMANKLRQSIATANAPTWYCY